VWREGTSLRLADAIAYVQRSRGPRDRPLGGWDSLTPTERRVATLAAEGHSNPQIAQQLFISRSSVKLHLTRAYGKLGVSSRTELAHHSPPPAP
jgi:DNA-binding CsgD family transcriptional regulator